MGKTLTHKHPTQRQWDKMTAGNRKDPKFINALREAKNCATCTRRMVMAVPVELLLVFAAIVMMDAEPTAPLKRIKKTRKRSP